MLKKEENCNEKGEHDNAEEKDRLQRVETDEAVIFPQKKGNQAGNKEKRITHRCHKFIILDQRCQRICSRYRGKALEIIGSFSVRYASCHYAEQR